VHAYFGEKIERFFAFVDAGPYERIYARIAAHHDELYCGERKKIGGGLWDITDVESDVALPEVVYAVAEEADGSRGRPDYADEVSEQCGFPRAVGAYDGEELAAPDAERDVVEYEPAVDCIGQVPD